MTAFFALLFLILASALNWVAFVWYTFGMWPLSWWPIPIFAVISTVITLAVRHIADGKD